MFNYKKLFNEKMQLTTQVERHLTFPTIQKEKLAEHLAKVAEKAFRLSKELFNDENLAYKMCYFGLIHDLPETQTSDIPSGVKHLKPSLKEILAEIEQETMDKYFPAMANDYKEFVESEEKQDIFGILIKICDLLDLLEFIELEEKLGNHHEILLKVKERGEKKLNRKFEQLYLFLKNEYENPTGLIKKEVFETKEFLEKIKDEKEMVENVE